MGAFILCTLYPSQRVWVHDYHTARACKLEIFCACVRVSLFVVKPLKRTGVESSMFAARWVDLYQFPIFGIRSRSIGIATGSVELDRDSCFNDASVFKILCINREHQCM